MPTTIEILTRARARRVLRFGMIRRLTRALLLVTVLSVSALSSPGVSARSHALSNDVAAETLVLVNLIRQRLSGCREDGSIVGQDLSRASQRVAATRTPLAWNRQLADIARNQAEAMAQQQFFSHRDADGNSIGARASTRGYRWRLIGENLASGQRNIASVMRGWLRSFTHCRNLIDDRFTEVGLAGVESTDPDDVYGTYWVMVLSKPALHQPTQAQPILLAHTEQAITAALFAALN